MVLLCDRLVVLFAFSNGVSPIIPAPGNVVCFFFRGEDEAISMKAENLVKSSRILEMLRVRPEFLKFSEISEEVWEILLNSDRILTEC